MDTENKNIEYVKFNRLLTQVGLGIEELMDFDIEAQENMRIALDNLKDIYQSACDNRRDEAYED